MKNPFIFIIFIALNFYSQENLSLKIDKIINDHLLELRSIVGSEATIFMDIDYTADRKNLKLQEKDLFLEAGINAKKLNKNNDYFLIRFIISNKEGKLVMNGINFRIKKISGKELDLINLGNGNTYELSE